MKSFFNKNSLVFPQFGKISKILSIKSKIDKFLILDDALREPFNFLFSIAILLQTITFMLMTLGSLTKNDPVLFFENLFITTVVIISATAIKLGWQKGWDYLYKKLKLSELESTAEKLLYNNRKEIIEYLNLLMTKQPEVSVYIMAKSAKETLLKNDRNNVYGLLGQLQYIYKSNGLITLDKEQQLSDEEINLNIKKTVTNTDNKEMEIGSIKQYL